MGGAEVVILTRFTVHSRLQWQILSPHSHGDDFRNLVTRQTRLLLLEVLTLYHNPQPHLRKQQVSHRRRRLPRIRMWMVTCKMHLRLRLGSLV